MYAREIYSGSFFFSFRVIVRFILIGWIDAMTHCEFNRICCGPNILVEFTSDILTHTKKCKFFFYLKIPRFCFVFYFEVKFFFFRILALGVRVSFCCLRLLKFSHATFDSTIIYFLGEEAVDRLYLFLEQYNARRLYAGHE